MAIQTSVNQSQGQYVRANGIDIHYIDLGHGQPVLALNNGMVSTNPIWQGHPAAYGSHLTTLAEHFRVIAPDMRGSGKTKHPGGPITYQLLADDMVALIGALGLDSEFREHFFYRRNRQTRGGKRRFDLLFGFRFFGEQCDFGSRPFYEFARGVQFLLRH